PRSTLFPYTTLFRSLALIYPERVVYADNRQTRSEQTDIDRLEAMGYTEMKLPPTYQFAYPAYCIKLQPADVPAMVIKEDYFVRRDRKSTRLNSSHVK